MTVSSVDSPDPPHEPTLHDRLEHAAAGDGRDLLKELDDATIASTLAELDPTIAVPILMEFDDERRGPILAAAPPALRQHWVLNLGYPEDSVGAFMEPPTGLFPPDLTVAQAVGQLREMVKTNFITYGYVVEPGQKLIGVLVMRDLLLADPNQKLRELMIPNPFWLDPKQELMEAMHAVLDRHYPVYPVCEPDGRLVGTIRGQTLFEQQAIEISAQVGSMVGVEKEERLSTPWQKSLLFRHPWLQLNLLTAFVAAAVVGVFEKTLEQIVILAVFLPVLAGQSGNTGCQALAVALRGLTLGEFESGSSRSAIFKEGLLGLLNGALVGVSAAVGMFIYATVQRNPDALGLAGVVMAAMIGSCIVSGVAGATIPLVLKKLGADPATASSIFLTTATDVVSMGLFLGLATLLLL